MKILEIVFNMLIIILSLLGILYIVNSSVTCNIIISTEYPFCNGFHNYTIHSADFYTIKYVRNMYGYSGQNKWFLDNCTLSKPHIFLIKDIRRDKYPFYSEEFKIK